MSQAGIINIAGGGGGGSPVQTLTGNSGGAVPPTANNIFTLGGESSVNSVNGITIVGNPGTSTLTTTLTNRLSGSVTTTDATPTALITFTAAGVPTVYNFESRVAAFDSTDVAGGVYLTIAGVRTTGAATILTGVTDETFMEEAALNASNCDVIVTGNSVLVEVTGIAGKTIDWSGTLTYVQVT